MSIVRNNLMTRKGYTPYCGDGKSCSMPRTFFNGSQFECPHCRWKSGFPDDFITTYKREWGMDVTINTAARQAGRQKLKNRLILMTSYGPILNHALRYRSRVS